MRFIFACLITICGLGVAVSARAESPSDGDRTRFTFRLYIENDSQVLKPNDWTDKAYTSGVKLTVTHHPDWADTLARQLDFLLWDTAKPTRTAMGYFAGHSIHTPRDLEQRELIEDDVPYSAWLYGGAFFQRATSDVADHFELSLGVVGESALGESFQDAVHEFNGGVAPRGWANQLLDEVAVQTYVRRKWRAAAWRAGEVEWEVIPQAGLALGSVHRHLEGSILFRAGANLPDDFGPGRLDDPTIATGRWPKDLGAYLFVRVAGRLVEFNTFVDGSNWRRGHGLNSEPLIGEIQLGGVIRYRRLEVGYSQTYMTDRFDGDRAKHSWGALNVSYTHHF